MERGGERRRSEELRQIIIVQLEICQRKTYGTYRSVMRTGRWSYQVNAVTTKWKANFLNGYSLQLPGLLTFHHVHNQQSAFSKEQFTKHGNSSRVKKHMNCWLHKKCRGCRVENNNEYWNFTFFGTQTLRKFNFDFLS